MSEEIKNLTEETVEENAAINEPKAEEPEKLDSPLVVHKKSDASYQEDTSAFEMNQTHTEDESGPTLRRHRFKKEEKSKAPALLTALIILVVIAGVFAGLYYTHNLPFMEKETSTTKVTTTEPTTSLEEKYAGTIVIKDTYIFVDGEEVDGLEGLQSELKYVDKSTTAYRIIDEHANSNFLNFNVLTLLEEMGFYDEKTEITHLESTGLIAYEETTTAPPETTQKSKKNKKSKKSKKKSSKQTTTKKKGN